MYHSVYDFKDFYNTPFGEIVRSVLGRKIHEFWRDARDMRVVGIGYPQPYLAGWLETAERCIAVSPARGGSYPWPEGARNLVAIAEETELPIETNSVDRVIVMHSLEYAELPKSNLQEIFRILKSNGRLLLVTPNRTGLWARTEWSPFGHGTPYSRDQLRTLLRESMFVYERSTTALFIPPVRSSLLRGSFDMIETVLSVLLPAAMGGVHIVEASKQVYSGVSVPSESKIVVRARLPAVSLPTS